MSLFRNPYHYPPLIAGMLGAVLAAFAIEASAKEASPQTTVCVPVDIDETAALQRDYAFPVVRCIVANPKANHNQNRENAQKTMVLAQVQEDVLLLEDENEQIGRASCRERKERTRITTTVKKKYT